MKNHKANTRRNLLRTGIFITALLIAAPSAMARTYTIWVDGLACPFCSYGIEKQLSKLPGVNSVKTNIKSGTVTLKTKDNRKIADADLRAAVDRAGFSVRKIK